MSSLVLVDSSVVVEALNADGRNWAVDLLRDLGRSRIALWDLLIGEILVGALDEAEFARVGLYLGQFTNLPPPTDVWGRAGRLGFELKRKDRTVKLADLATAVVAMDHGVPIVHRDQHYIEIAKVCDLEQEFVEPDDE